MDVHVPYKNIRWSTMVVHVFNNNVRLLTMDAHFFITNTRVLAMFPTRFGHCRPPTACPRKLVGAADLGIMSSNLEPVNRNGYRCICINTYLSVAHLTDNMAKLTTNCLHHDDSNNIDAIDHTDACVIYDHKYYQQGDQYIYVRPPPIRAQTR
jgi:hypothetical protein